MRIFQRNHLLDFDKVQNDFAGSPQSAKFSTCRSRNPRSAGLSVGHFFKKFSKSKRSLRWNIRDRIFQRNHVLDFENFLKKCPKRRNRLDRQVENIRRLRIFQRNHLLDFVFQNISKSAVGRDAKVSRLAGRERLADCGSSSVITFWTLSKFQNISESVVGRDSPIGVFSLCSVQTDMPIADVPA